MEQRLIQLKTTKYKQNKYKVQKIDDIIKNLKSQAQTNYTELLRSFNDLAMELEVSELKDLMEGYVDAPKQFGTTQLSTQKKMKGSYSQQQCYGYDSKRQFGNRCNNRGFRLLYNYNVNNDDEERRKRTHEKIKGSEYEQQEKDWYHGERSRFGNKGTGDSYGRKEYGVGTGRGYGYQPNNL